MITIDDFQKVEIKIGEIKSAEKIEGSNKLLRLEVDFGEKGSVEASEVAESVEVSKPRQIISGIANYFPDEKSLVGKKCAFVTNLEPRMIMGLESNGMVLAVSGDNFFSLLETSLDVLPGSAIK